MTSCEKLILSAARIFLGIQTTIAIFSFTLAFSMILHAAFFSDTGIVVYYMEFLAAIFDSKIVQRMWLCA